MKRRSIFALLLGGLIAGSCATPVDPCLVKIGSHRAVTPVDRSGKWWISRHEAVLKRVAKGQVDLLMIGDSITHGFDKAGAAMWSKYYAPRNAVNLGFSGDRTEHVLWRLDHGEIDGISPKLAVIMIGTNNSNRDEYTAAQIADGIKAIVCRLKTSLPETKILILGIFPRGATPNPKRAKNNEASRLAALMADNKTIYFLDINEVFLNDDGVLTREVMPDLLHPCKKGYQLWAEAIEPTVVKLMGE